MNTRRSKYLSIVVMALLVMTGCTASQLVTDIGIVANTAAAAVPLLFATGAVPLNPAVQGQLIAYLKVVSTAVIQSGTELQTVDTQPAKVSKIIGYFANAVLPVMPAGTPQTVVSAINAVSQAVVALLDQLQPKGAATARSGPVAASPMPLKVQALSKKDVQVLSAAQATAARSLVLLTDRR